jgi:hypothetical protein
MSVTMNGIPRTFDHFGGTSKELVGYSSNGSVTIEPTSLALGTYSCPDASISYNNSNAGDRDSNVYSSMACCTLEITKSGGVGEIIEGTFAGVVSNPSPSRIWVNLTQGSFSITNRGDGAGGATATH